MLYPLVRLLVVLSLFIYLLLSLSKLWSNTSNTAKSDVPVQILTNIIFFSCRIVQFTASGQKRNPKWKVDYPIIGTLIYVLITKRHKNIIIVYHSFQIVHFKNGCFSFTIISICCCRFVIKTDSAQRPSNKCKKYLPKNYSQHGNILNAIWNISL